ncbi:porin [Agrobacterium sp. AGB01]|uniref:porin n=1 Tax=Agrobacterium sp. AGB01 TaxID=2769302 RepID=UPI00177DBA35|nr:porin [Agrobacterium sp. AGB01]MBD9386421.1 porin [Agrobacterium sp. AGB01]
MNIKSLLIGSAAALAAVSGAQAADAIVAAEPEPLEYVRVCDAFGAGYFYIPGTETCLRIGGEVRFTVGFGEDVGANSTSDWYSATRGRVFFDTKTDSELGTIGTYIRLQGNYSSAGTPSSAVSLEQAYITVGGLKAGKALTWWDDTGINGELDDFADASNFNTISYLYDAGSFRIGLGVDDLSGEYNGSTLVGGVAVPNNPGNELGIEGYAQVDFGASNIALRGVYDFEAEEGALYATLVAPVGPGELNVAVGWASGTTVYVNNDYEWTVAASYALKATDKLTITPSASYWSTQDNVDAWGVGLLAEYQLAKGLKVGATVDYVDVDNEDDNVSGWVRLTRSF